MEIHEQCLSVLSYSKSKVRSDLVKNVCHLIFSALIKKIEVFSHLCTVHQSPMSGVVKRQRTFSKIPTLGSFSIRTTKRLVPQYCKIQACVPLRPLLRLEYPTSLPHTLLNLFESFVSPSNEYYSSGPHRRLILFYLLGRGGGKVYFILVHM